MSPSESEDDTKKINPQPEPLCLFCFPSKDDTPPEELQQEHQKTYVEAAPKEETKKEFLTAAMRRKMQHSTPRQPEPTTTLRAQQPDRKSSKRRSPSRKRLDEMVNSTDTSNESQERKKPQSYAEFKRNFHRQKTGRDSFRKKRDLTDARRRDEMWLRRRKDSGMKGRRQAQEPGRHLKSYLLNTVKDDKVSQKATIPLIEVLETIKDAWPPQKTLTLERAQDKSKKPTEPGPEDQTMKSEGSFLQYPQPLLNRRFSMPEEVMRKYSVTKERTSEESETNKTMPEITSPSSKDPDETIETEREIVEKGRKSEKMARPRRKSVLKSEVFSKTIDEEDLRPADGYDASISGKDTGSVYSKETVREKYEKTFYQKEGRTERSFVVLNEKERKKEEELIKSSDSEDGKGKSKRPPKKVSVVDTTTTKRVTQNEYYSQGKGIIKVKAMEKGSQTGECTCRTERFVSSTTASAKEESDESHSSKSLSSHSPEQLPKGDNEESDNLSSESDYIQCTCEELDSKETSSDMFASGKSTLSQTVSEKSTSTQDSTISINSVPTEGSSVSAGSNSTSPELDPKTSAKETTTSPDHTPRTPRSRGRPFNRMNRPEDQNYGQERRRDGNQERPRGGRPSGRGGGGGGYTRKCPIHTAKEFETNGKDEEEYPETNSGNNGEYTRQRPQFPEDLYNIPDRNLDPSPSSHRDSDDKLNVSGSYALPGNPKQEAKKPKAKQSNRNLDISPSSRDKKPNNPKAKPSEDLYNLPNKNLNISPSSRKNPKPKLAEDSYHSSNKKLDRSPSSRDKKPKNPKSKQPEDLYNIPDRNLDPIPLSARETAQLKKSNTYPDVANIPKNSESYLSSCKDTTHSDSPTKAKKASPNRERKKWSTHPEPSNIFGNAESHLSSCKDTTHSDSPTKTKKISPHRERKKWSTHPPDDLSNLPLNAESHVSSCKDTTHSDSPIKTKKNISPHRESEEKLAKPTHKSKKDSKPRNEFPEDLYNIPDRNVDRNPSPHRENPHPNPKCPIHRPPEDESPVRSVRFECHNGNCSTPTSNDPPVPKIDLSGGDLSSTPKQSEPTTERFEEISEKSEEPQPDYQWAKLSQEEIYMMQQQRHRKFVENHRNFSNPLPKTPDNDSLSNCSANGSTFREIEDDSLFMIPRYSALPRTLSMVVNTSSGDSIHEDSDNQSLVDSLEEHPTTTIHKLYFDTKQEAKPVRGDATVLPEIPKLKHKEPRGRAFFVSINEPYGEGELLPNIDKIPEPPEKIKDRIFERHLKICKKHNKNLDIEKAEEGRRRAEMQESLNKRNLKKIKKKEEHKKLEEAQKTSRVEKKVNRSLQVQFDKPKEIPIENKRKLPRIKGRYGSKIPVAVSYQSTSTSPERDTPEKSKRISRKGPKPRPKKERFKQPNESPKKPELPPPKPPENQVPQNIPKPQAVIHPSQMPIIDNSELNKRRLSFISSLESTATILQLQPVQFPPRTFNQTKRSPVMKFRQRFEVIPEERSSSLTSSAEDRWSNEKNRRASLPVKLTETSTSPTHPELDQQPAKKDRPHFRRYSLGSISNLIIAKLMGKPLQAISCIQRGPNNENQQIIVLSPKDALGPNGSSSKGRDALLAMNREDFERLSKGWMNFYLLKENCDTSENSQHEDDPNECKNGHCEKGKVYTLTDFKTVEQEVADAIQERSQRILQESTDNKDTKTEGPQNVSKSYSIFLNSQEKSDSTEDVKTSEFLLIEKAENHELMCLNNKEEEEKKNDKQQSTEDNSKALESISKTKKKCKTETIKLDENVRLHCSNTILQTTTKPIDVSPRSLSAKTRRQSSLPELRITTPKNPVLQKMKSSFEILPKVSGKPSDQDGMDSDSTVYFQPPNPKVPLLPLEGSGDFPSDGTFSSTSSDSENEMKAPSVQLPVKYLPLRKRGISSRTRIKRELYYDDPLSTKPDTGWTVTVAGTVELTRSAPDVEMRLSFPVNSTRPPVASQSDSGFAEDANSSQNIDNPKLRRQSSTILPPANVKQKWTVTVKKPSQGSLQEGNKLKTKKNYRILPDLGQPQSRNSKKVLKNTTPRSEKDRDTVERKLCSIWPKVQRIIQNELGSHNNARLVSELSKVYEDDLRLSVQGNAVPFEKKPRAPTMTERDLTRGLTARSSRSKS